MADVLSHEWFTGTTPGEIDRMASVAGGADPAAPVPSCPGWTMARLVKHTGIVHRWATHILTTRSAEPVSPRSLDAGLPESERDYPGWLAAGAAPLAEALREAGPETAVWTWGPGRDSGWWARRMLHETTVHRADAELATGRRPGIDAVTAADGIDEFLANLPSASRPSGRLAELPAGQSLHLHATDTDGEWLIRFTGPGAGAPGAGTPGAEIERGHAKATTAVRGPAAALLLFTYGRIRADDEALTVFGDEGLAAAWQEKAAL